jgi:hypothetical protein
VIASPVSIESGAAEVGDASGCAIDGTRPNSSALPVAGGGSCRAAAPGDSVENSSMP